MSNRYTTITNKHDQLNQYLAQAIARAGQQRWGRLPPKCPLAAASSWIGTRPAAK